MVLRRLLLLAFALALVVVGASATLRLSANGVGCAPWPSCYGRAETAEAANRAAGSRLLRIAHRIAASAFALVAVAAVVLGWRRWGRPARLAAAALLALTAVLAWVGRLTPSPVPAVTLVNLLGGFALLALLAYLLAWRDDAQARPGVAARAGLIALLTAVAVQAALGALLSVRLAGAACVPECEASWLSGTALLLDPLRPGSAAELADRRAAGTLQSLHRMIGLALMVVAIPAAQAMLRRHGRRAAAAMVAAAATGGLGFLAASPAPALLSVALHALAAGLLCAVLGAALAGSEAARRPAP